MSIIVRMLEKALPFPTLQITNRVWEDETVARTDRLNDTTSDIVLAST